MPPTHSLTSPGPGAARISRCAAAAPRDPAPAAHPRPLLGVVPGTHRHTERAGGPGPRLLARVSRRLLRPAAAAIPTRAARVTWSRTGGARAPGSCGPRAPHAATSVVPAALDPRADPGSPPARQVSLESAARGEPPTLGSAPDCFALDSLLAIIIKVFIARCQKPSEACHTS